MPPQRQPYLMGAPRSLILLSGKFNIDFEGTSQEMLLIEEAQENICVCDCGIFTT
ncbi:MAG: hypothetical protein Ct9H300mP11_30890 [Chloroflexota bacterium]|nr:MAG: hypothetical protein Ct9H300mP11_30890 [Chloroflexota bacterium]